MPRLISIVEGPGDVEALPVLIRKVLYEQYQNYDWVVAQPKNANGCTNLTKPSGVETFIQYALLEPECGGVLIFIDGDAVHPLLSTQVPSNCSPAFANYLAGRIRALNPPISVVVVVARWMYESLFLSSLESIAGRQIKGLAGLPENVRYEGDVEEVRNPKAWIEDRFPRGRGYSETRDQAAMTDFLDLALVEARSRSFQRLKHALAQILDSHAQGTPIVTP